MDAKFFLGIGLAIVLVFTGSAIYTTFTKLPGPAGTSADHETLYQVSTSDDRKRGGHILDFTVPANTLVEYDVTPVFTMALPTNGSFTGTDLSQDLSRDLKKVEN